MTAGALLGVVFVAAALAFAILRWPELVVNPKNLERAANYLRTKNILDVRWSKIDVEVESRSLLAKRVSLKITDFCLLIPGSPTHTLVDTCLPSTEIGAAVSFRQGAFHFDEMGPVNLQGGHFTYTVLSPEDSGTLAGRSKPKSDVGGFVIPGFFPDTRILSWTIHLDRWEVRTPEQTLVKGAIDLKTERPQSAGTTGARIRALVNAELPVDGTSKPHQFKGDLRLINPQGFGNLDTWKLDSDLSADLADGTQIKGQAKVDPRGDVAQLEADYSIHAEVRRSGLRVKADLVGAASPDYVRTRVKGQARGLIPNISTLSVDQCDLAMARADVESEGGTLTIDCPVLFRIGALPPDLQPLKIPLEFGTRIKANLATATYPFSPSSLIKGKVDADFAPVVNELFKAGGGVQTELSGIITEFPKNWTIQGDLAFDLALPRFERWVSQFAGTAWDIWAPIRPMHGDVAFKSRGQLSLVESKAHIELGTNLSSTNQKFKVFAKAEIQALNLTQRPHAHLDGYLSLDDVVVQLPPLPKPPAPGSPRLDPLPKFFPDSRIKQSLLIAEPTKVPTDWFTYSLRIETPENRPVRLLTPITQSLIPVQVKLALQSGLPPEGSLTVQAFPLELFRRRVELKYFKLNLASPAEESELSGLIQVPYPDYTIAVQVLGTTARPQVKFTSDPMLPEDQIIAVLLFGQKLDALDPEQMGSIGDATAALRTGALSLVSLYYLSSFNIQGMDYDPKTKNASISIRVGDQTSVSLGGGQGEESIGVRRRLGGGWAVTGRLSSPTDPGARTLSTFLEWGHQY